MTDTAQDTAPETSNLDRSEIVRFKRTETSQPREKTADIFKMPTLGQLLETEIPERQHLLFPWLREHENCMIYASSGVGKSMFALSTAIAIVGGGEFLG